MRYACYMRVTKTPPLSILRASPVSPGMWCLSTRTSAFRRAICLPRDLMFRATTGVDVYGQSIGDYMQMGPVLERFAAFLEQRVPPGGPLHAGEDPGQS